jgi:hypothetical protein
MPDKFIVPISQMAAMIQKSIRRSNDECRAFFSSSGPVSGPKIQKAIVIIIKALGRMIKTSLHGRKRRAKTARIGIETLATEGAVSWKAGAFLQFSLLKVEVIRGTAHGMYRPDPRPMKKQIVIKEG